MPRTAHYCPIDELKPLIAMDKLNLPCNSIVRGIELEEYQDWEGEDLLKVYLILTDNSPDDGKKLHELTRPVIGRIREIVQAAGDTRFVFPWVGTQADYDVRNSFDPENA